LIGTAARFLLQTYAQGLTTPSHAAVIMILEPIWTALIAAAWFNERMSELQLIGCSMIFAALIINRWSSVNSWLKGRER
jgi:drug/metabolite transporter (DMT)-like permease